ncbi:MAG: hypothetical protein ACYC5K_09395 [Saccharofermentanales bacterium]
MEIVFELLYEIFVEGLVATANNRKIPMVVRLMIASILCGGLIAISILVSFSALNATGIVGGVICWIISLALIFLWLFWCVKIVQNRNKL